MPRMDDNDTGRRRSRPPSRRTSGREEPSSRRPPRRQDSAEPEEQPSRRGSRRSSSRASSPSRDSGKSASAATGWDAVVEKKEELDERRNDSYGPRDFWLLDGETAVIQPLQDEPYCFDAHRVKVRGKWTHEPCQLTHYKTCQFCDDQVPASWRAAIKVLDYRGNWDKDAKEHKWDAEIVKAWQLSHTVALQLKEFIDRRNKPLSKMVLEVTRSGSGKKTSYNIALALDDDDQVMQPLSSREYEDEFNDISEYFQPRDPGKGYVDYETDDD